MWGDRLVLESLGIHRCVGTNPGLCQRILCLGLDGHIAECVRVQGRDARPRCMCSDQCGSFGNELPLCLGVSEFAYDRICYGYIEGVGDGMLMVSVTHDSSFDKEENMGKNIWDCVYNCGYLTSVIPLCCPSSVLTSLRATLAFASNLLILLLHDLDLPRVASRVIWVQS